MNKPLTNSAQRVQNFLVVNGYECIVKELPESTRTAEEAANTIGCHVAQIAKSLVFIDKETGNPILVIASGINRVDIKKLKIQQGFILSKQMESL